MPIVSTVLWILVIVLTGLAVLGWIALRIRPAPFKPFPQASRPAARTVPLPAGLPAPVERYYRTLYGEEVPVIESAVITGRARMKPFGPFYLPARYRFSHIAGQSYRHYIEVTLFGLPIMKINERYVDGVGRMELPVGVIENEPKVNQGANLGLWAESGWLPAVFLTDPRVRWAPVDTATALLIVPFEDREETFVVRFNPQTGLADFFESMRYHSAESTAKNLWINEALHWGELDGRPFMQEAAVTWMDQREPWAYISVEEIVYNADLSEYITARGE